MRREERWDNALESPVRFDLAHGLRHGLGAEGAADLLEGEELGGGGVLDEVDVGEAALVGEVTVSTDLPGSGGRDKEMKGNLPRREDAES